MTGINTNPVEIEPGDIAAALIGQTIWSVEVTGDSLSDDLDENFLVLETSGGVRLYADDPTAYRHELAGARVPTVTAEAIANIQTAADRVSTVCDHSPENDELNEALTELQQAVRYLTGEEVPS